LEEAYKFRNNEIITISEIKEKFLNLEGKSLNLEGNSTVCDFPSEIQEGNTQSKVNKSKVNLEAAPPAFPEDPFPSKPEKKKKDPLRDRDPENDMERVEKAYQLNWESLYAQGKVKAIKPVVNWKHTRKLLKTHFKNLDVELIIQAIKNGLKDDWVMNHGYSLGIMLSAGVLNRLINASPSAAPAGLADKEGLSGLTSTF
jgi:hypothetical protein